MSFCQIERILWSMALFALLAALYFGNAQKVGVVLASAAGIWYGIVCPFAEEVQDLFPTNKERVN